MIRDINLDLDEIATAIDNALEDRPDVVKIKEAIIKTLQRVNKASNDKTKADLYAALEFARRSIEYLELEGEADLDWALRDIDKLSAEYLSALERARVNTKNRELRGQALDTLEALCQDAPDAVNKMFKK
jgi:hypothetical protein